MHRLKSFLEGSSDSEAFAGLLLEIAQAIVLLLDRDGRILFYNKYLERLSGIPFEEARGQDWFSTFLPERDHERIRALFGRGIRGETVEGNVNPIRARGGSEHEIEWFGSLLRNGEEIVGLLSVGIDITEQLRLKEQLAERERLATIGTTASIFAHEVGNPLNNMVLQGRLLAKHMRDANVEDRLIGSLDGLLEEIRRLNSLLEEFRRFGAQHHLERKATDLLALVHEVTQLHVGPHAADSIRLECELPPQMPKVLAKRDKLKQVLVNLCKNAIEAMPNGGTLRVAGSCSDEAITLRFADTGEGIPAGLDVFQPFETTKANGSGLGLPIARQIVADHGGDLRYDSEVGKGTTFTLVLPHTTFVD